MGSFNPPHNGHIKVVNYLLEKKYIDKILIVPTLNYWNKNDLIDIKDRINMLSFFANNNIIIDKKHNDCIYTYDLITKLKDVYPNDELIIIIGADNVINLSKWKNINKLIKYPFIIMNRNNIDINKYLNNMKGNFTILSDYPYIDISSSEIRDKLDSKYLDKRVLKYIKENHLYGGSSD